MHIWPAIDLRGGKCVRLQQGDYRRETVFGNDPVEVALRWQDAGADRLHLVDLDGARDGVAANGDVVQAIVQAIHIPCQLGGGVRDKSVIDAWLQRGVARLVIGTRAAKDPQWMLGMCREFPDRLVLGLDARDGRVATDGWHIVSERSAAELANEFAGQPLAGIVYTDISRDGMLQGPNIEATRRLRDEIDFPIIASGGVTTADDVFRLAQLNIEGCIIGRALYEGTLSLSEALSAALNTTNHN